MRDGTVAILHNCQRKRSWCATEGRKRKPESTGVQVVERYKAVSRRRVTRHSRRPRGKLRRSLSTVLVLSTGCCSCGEGDERIRSEADTSEPKQSPAW
ncbi:hypothetical protein PYCCODRAFT_1440882 [Trametes coccinea BRFM310]|uniref:Uncharacterized protein n=1 Tax=Trametes coccinea (strain BRFM310) TaxID=1353009 RepID=A0A1Y2I7Q8_TRAC3|nr:hypothetical protein PYCCODRAFT_1440882 [Trametes coccinea BRFM310]